VKFKILPKVHGFTDAKGVHHLPGEIVDLPTSYEGETWLEKVEIEKPKPAMVEVKAEGETKPEAEEPKPSPLEKTEKKGKKSKS